MLDALAVKERLLELALKIQERSRTLTGVAALEAVSRASGVLEAIAEIRNMEIMADALAHAQPDPAIPGIGPAERMAIADYARSKGETGPGNLRRESDPL